MPVLPLQTALARVPPGAWAVAVSGGADSVALLRLVLHRPDVRPHVLHLDHETRGRASTTDAQFVADLCTAHNLPHTIARRSDLEPHIHDLPANPSARYRALRHAFFRRACQGHALAGVLLAHHAADQAETILQRLLRGSAPAGLAGMRIETRVRGLTLLRPLLDTPPEDLRAFLRSVDQPWREDASNASPAYQRNRLRPLLAHHPALATALRALGHASASLVDWSRATAPALADAFPTTDLAALPYTLADESARHWLTRMGAPPNELTPAVLARLVDMSRDAATPPRQHFPGQLLVRRRAGKIWIEPPAPG